MAPTNGHSNGHTGHTGTTQAIHLEQQFSAHNYHPIPIVFDRGLGAKVWDPEGREYIDCLSAYSAVNQGHCHPRIVATLTEQAHKLTLSSRAFFGNGLGRFAEKVTTLLGYEMVLPMNTGAEAVETALKLARKWAYKHKGVPEGKALIFSAVNNFHGRTFGAISMSTDPESRVGFGPYLPGVGPVCPVGGDGKARMIRFGVAEDLERALEEHGERVAAFLVEPMQGEAGIVVPPADYLPRVQAACRKHNVLLICDEIQTGLGRTGKMLAHQHYDGVKADIVTLGKALSGGVYPVSCVLASRDVMLSIKSGEHGSTYGGNPLACAVACTALDVLVEEDLCNRALSLGKTFRAGLETLKEANGGGWVTEIRGVGLFTAIVIDEHRSKRGRGAWELCCLMASKGALAKPTHVNIIRLTPPLVISEAELKRVVDIIRESIEELDELEHIPLDNDSKHEVNTLEA